MTAVERRRQPLAELRLRAALCHPVPHERPLQRKVRAESCGMRGGEAPRDLEHVRSPSSTQPPTPMTPVITASPVPSEICSKDVGGEEFLGPGKRSAALDGGQPAARTTLEWTIDQASR